MWDVEELCALGDAPRLERLLQRSGRHYASRLDDLLVLGARSGRAGVVDVLLRHGADANTADAGGRTVLHFAALSGKVAVVCSALENGADKSKRCRAGVSAEELARSVGNHTIAGVIDNWSSPWDRILPELQHKHDDNDDDDDVARLEGLMSQKERGFGPKHVGLVPTLERLAQALMQRNDTGAAIEMQRRACSLLGARKQDPDFRDRLCESLGQLGRLYAGKRDHNEACTAFEKAISYMGADILPARERRLILDLSTSLFAVKRYEHQEAVLLRIVALVEKETADLDHPQLVEPLSHLGRCQCARKRFAPGIESLARALAIVDKHLGPVHVDIARCLDSLGQALGQQRRFAEAEQVFRRALHIRQSPALANPGPGASILAAHNRVAWSIIQRDRHAKR